MKQISRFQEGIDHLGPQVEFLLPDAIQKVFQDVGSFREIGEPERARAALDGMSRTKDGVELFRIGIFHIQTQQERFHRRQVLSRFLEKHLVELAHVDGHDSPFPCGLP